MIEIITEYYGDSYEELLDEFHASQVSRINERYVVVSGYPGIMPDYSYVNYEYSQIPKCYGLLASSNLDEIGVTQVQRRPNLALRGQGVLVGIVDTGIDYQNPLFQYADGTSKIAALYDQELNQRFEREEINRALRSENPLEVVPSRDTNGHGTYMAGLIAGNEDEVHQFSGVAPDSELVIVKLKQADPLLRRFYYIDEDADVYSEADVMKGIQYLLSVAQISHKPIAIFLGLGTTQGGHDGRGPLNEYLMNTTDSAGVAVTVAGGNEGQERRHFYGEGLSDSDTQMRITSKMVEMEISVGSDVSGFTMELWGYAPNRYSVGITSPEGRNIERSIARIRETREIQFLLEETVIHLSTDIVERSSGDQVIIFQFERPTEGIWIIQVYEEGIRNLGFHCWLPLSNFLKKNTYFLRSNPYTTMTCPGNSKSLITVESYDHNNMTLYPNNSRGFSRINDIKPELLAPGVNIVGPGLRSNFVTKSGSSVAAAQVSGITALLLEWGVIRGNQSNMDGVLIRNFLIRGARRNPNIVYPNRQWGYGVVNLYQTFLQLS